MLACQASGLFHQAFFWQEIQLVFWLYLNVAWYLGTTVLHTYQISRTARSSTIIKEMLSAILVHLCSIALFVVLTEYYILSRNLFLSFFAYSVSSLLVWRLVSTASIKFFRRSGFNTRNVIILGYNKRAADLRKLFEQSPDYGYRFIGYFDNLSPSKADAAYLGGMSQVQDYVTQHQIDEVYYANPSEADTPYLRQLVSFAEGLDVKVKLVPELSGFHSHEVRLDFYHHLPIITFRKEPLELWHNQVIKRTFDLVFSFCITVFLLSWLIPIIGLLIKLDSPGPIFFRQRRTGKDNRDFWCLKFRTMYVNKEADKTQATRGDRRITKLGAFLRKSNLDELPQFINVLVGDMSVVGPRPHMLSHTETFAQSIDNYMVRHLIKPGITGLAQAKGYRGETQTIWDIKSRVRVDIFYIEHWSFWLDLKVMALTALQMVKGHEKAF